MSVSIQKLVVVQGGSLEFFGQLVLPPPTTAWHVTAMVKTLGFDAVTNGALVVILGSPVVSQTPYGERWTYPVTLTATAAQTTGWPLGPLISNIRCADESTPALVIPTWNYNIELIRGVTDA